MTDDLRLREKLLAIREGRFEIDDSYDLFAELDGSDSTWAEPEIAKLLDHPEPFLRSSAIKVIAYTWEMRHFRDKLEAMLANDPDDDVRYTAASALGWLFRGSRSAKATALLLNKLRSEDEDNFVRVAAYKALLDIWLRPEGRAITLEELKRSADRVYKLANKGVTLARELNRAVAAGDTATADAIREELSRPDESWKERVDWDAVAAIERGEVPTLRRPGRKDS